MHNRDDSFDIARGIGILCVILGHLAWNGTCYRIVYTFHMPLFFIMSGWFIDSRMSAGQYFFNRCNKLLPAYGFVVVCQLLISSLFGILRFSYSPLVPISPIEVLIRALYASGSVYNKTPFNIGSIGAIWFLPALILATSFVQLVIKSINRKITQLLIMLLAFAASVFTAKLIWLPLSVQSAGSAALFIYVGSSAREYAYKKCERSKKACFLVMALGTIVLFYEYYLFLYVEIARAYFPYAFSTVLCAIIISFSIIILSSVIRRFWFIRRILTFYGRFSLPIMCYHSLLRFYFTEDTYARLVYNGRICIISYVAVFLIHLVFCTMMTELSARSKLLGKVFRMK